MLLDLLFKYVFIVFFYTFL